MSAHRSIYVRLPIKRNPITAVTTNTRPQKFFSSGSNLRFGGRQSTVTMVFHALGSFGCLRLNCAASLQLGAGGGGGGFLTSNALTCAGAPLSGGMLPL